MSRFVDNAGLSVELQMDGTLLTMPAELVFGYRNDALIVHGSVHADKAHPVQIVQHISQKAAEQFGEYLEQLAGLLPEKLDFYYEKGQFLLWTTLQDSRFGMVWKGQDLACLVCIQPEDGAAPGTFAYYIAQAAHVFGIEQIFLYGRKGSQASLPFLTHAVLGAEEVFSYPASLNDCRILFCGRFSYEKEKDLVGKFLYQAFGMESMSLTLFMGMTPGGFKGYAMLPVLSGGVFSARELYLGIECGTQTRMVLSGTFQFSFIKDAVFTVAGSVAAEGFTLEAYAKMEQPAVIYKSFRIGDTALAIGVGVDGMNVRMLCSLYIGEIRTFGAVGAAVKAGAVSMEFISAAVTDITLPKLIKNIFGTGVTFADALDFLELSGLPLQGASQSRILVDQKADVRSSKIKEQVVSQFNQAVHSDSFALSSSSINLERIAGTTGEDILVLTDKSRMRHYSIDSAGRLKLQAQFYYSLVDASLGDYVIRKGVFVCGCITLFHKLSFKALFSMSEEDGVLAYASVDSFDLGIIQVGPSGIASADHPLLYFPQDSLLWLLMDHRPEAMPPGAVFFLRSGRQECSFYLDGKVRLFGVFEFAAKIIYADRQICIDTRFNIGSLIQTTFQIRASYGDFSNTNFSVLLVVDCTGLEQKMRKAQADINRAIEKLRDKIDSAQKTLTQAQRNVNELYSQIDTLNQRINSCKYAISSARWYAKAFVAIAKGAEIAAYEVAKAGVYVAIGVANAALEVAKLAVSAAGAIGEGVLRAVNGAIDAALNLFFIKYIRLYAAASAKGGCFQAEMEFVALGKTIYLKKEIKAASFFNTPDQMLDRTISDQLEPELAQIENGSFKSNRRKYKKIQCNMQGCRKMFRQGMEQLESGTALIQGMSQSYMDHCGEMLPQYEHFNESYVHALGEVEAVLSITEDAVDFKKMNDVADLVQKALKEDSNTIQEEKRQALGSAVEEYEAAVRLAGKMQDGVKNVRSQRQQMHVHLEQIKQAEVQNLQTRARNATIPEERIGQVLNDTEELLYTHFPITRGRGDYINLSRETKIQNSLDEMRSRMGLTQSAENRKNRNRHTPLTYTERL